MPDKPNLPEIKKLLHNFRCLIENTGVITSQLEILLRMMKSTEDLLDVSRVLDEKLQELDLALDALDAALLALQPVPYVGQACQVLEPIVKQVKQTVNQISRQVSSIEKQIKPQREKLGQIRKKLARFAEPLIKLQRFIEQELIKLEKTLLSNKKLSDSRYKNSQLSKIEELSGKLNGLLKEPNRYIAEINEMVEPIFTTLKEINTYCKRILDLIEPIIEKINELKELTDELDVIHKILDKEITFGPVHVKIKDLLSGNMNMPFKDELMKIAMKELEPHIKKISSSKEFGIESLPRAVFMVMQVEKKSVDANVKNDALTTLFINLLQEKNPEKTFMLQNKAKENVEA
ncbi:MAG: hypothetical protein HOO91_16820 [Bacteroidales bacterium]|nr:hypothetical protein [Bacteroidales bacterium]